jgi:hypothetical protein
MPTPPVALHRSPTLGIPDGTGRADSVSNPPKVERRTSMAITVGHSRKGSIADINVTPMADVTSTSLR